MIHRRHDENLQYCRYGCNAKEDARHVVMFCVKTKRKRDLIKSKCVKMQIEFTMKSVFTEMELQDDLEDLISVFLNT